MKIGDVRVRLVRHSDGALRAVASFTIDDCFVVHDIKIFERDGQYLVAMPSRKTNEGGYKDIAHPLNSETREAICQAILPCYFALRDEPPALSEEGSSAIHPPSFRGRIAPQNIHAQSGAFHTVELKTARKFPRCFIFLLLGALLRTPNRPAKFEWRSAPRCPQTARPQAMPRRLQGLGCRLNFR